MILTATFFWSDNSDFLHTQSSPFARDSTGQITGVRMMEAQREREVRHSTCCIVPLSLQSPSAQTLERQSLAAKWTDENPLHCQSVNRWCWKSTVKYFNEYIINLKPESESFIKFKIQIKFIWLLNSFLPSPHPPYLKLLIGFKTLKMGSDTSTKSRAWLQA